MFSAIRLVLKYLRWYASASNGRGHGVHSPFVYRFIRDVLMDKKDIPGSEEIEKIREQLLRNETVLTVTDLGAGSLQVKQKERKISRVAATSLKTSKYARLLGKIACYFKAETILELGTSLGITTSYLATSKGKVFTIEGDPEIAAIAQETFKKREERNAGRGSEENIELFTGDFEGVLPAVLNKAGKIDMVFIDGNHRREPTLSYYETIRPSVSEKGFMVFDDIYWSREMEEAWIKIKSKPEVTLTIDLFFIGLVFFDPKFKQKQHFRLRY